MTDFQKLWAGQTISLFGSLISRTALAWCAVDVLHATPWQLAVLALCDRLPGFLIGLLAGVWVDRVRRRPLLIGTDVLRALLVSFIPLAAIGGWLGFPLLLVVAALTGALSTLFDVAYQAYVPSVADEDTLVRANSKLTFTACLAEILAFGLAGWLVQLIGAPKALFIDAASFIVSALSLLWIRHREALPEAQTASDSGALFAEAKVGAAIVLGHPTLRRLLLGELVLALCMGMAGTVYLLFVSRELGFPSGHLGMIFAIGGFTSLMGATLAERVVLRLGKERAAFGGLTLVGAGMLLNGLAPRQRVPGYAALIGNQLVTDPGWTLYEIQQTTLRQELSPPETLGRVNATFRVAALGMGLLGTLLAGAIASHFSARAAILLGATLVVLVGAWLLSTVRETETIES
jgi:Na+/melibiose symporter-like transporter